tara:strand:- start:97 stop:807 length:711 start_codon:yes stop_codon:yes gene_type:complete
MDTKELLVVSKLPSECVTTIQVIEATATLSEQSVRSFTTMVNCMADEVSGIDSVSVADKVQHLMLTYAEPMKAIKGDKNLMATIRGMLWCALAPDVLVEVKPKKGEEAAVFQKAGEVTQGAARHVVAKLKQAVAERDQTDAEREAADAAQAEREEKAAEAKKAADILEAAATAKRKAVEQELFENTAFAFVTAEQQRPKLAEAMQDWPEVALRAFIEEQAAFLGCKLAVNKTAPSK